MENEIHGKKKLTNIGSSLVLIVNKAFLNDTDIKSGDLVEFSIKKVVKNGERN